MISLGKPAGTGLILVSLLTPLALTIHGYHPYAEDGGLYVAGIKHLLDPTLYPASKAFVDAHLRFSLFAPMVAGLTRLSHLSLPTILLCLHLASIWTTLWAVWLLAQCFSASRAACAGAVSLMAAWLTLPVAGTSLILMDPYLTARGISLPGTLLALAALLRFAPIWNTGNARHLDRSGAASSRRGAERPPYVVFAGVPRLASGTSVKRPLPYLAAFLCLLLVAAMHPLMAAYAVADLLLLSTLLSRRPGVRLWGTLALCALAFVSAALLNATAAPEPSGYLPIAASRYYWFLSQWHWYELLGLAGPLLMLAPTAFRHSHPIPQALARMAIASGTTAILIALAFAHEQAATHLVARLQPLRAFQVVYVLMIISLGSWLSERVLRQSVWRRVAFFATFGGVMFFVQRNTYPSSKHVEWPGAPPANQWQQAFLWVAANTPKNALFALDADYTALPGEDTQGFRAIAERSALPDYSKDGGEASITPALTADWRAGQRAQARLSRETDEGRLTALRPLNVTWVVLQRDAQTAFACPYRNPLVKVCRLP